MGNIFTTSLNSKKPKKNRKVRSGRVTKPRGNKLKQTSRSRKSRDKIESSYVPGNKAKKPQPKSKFKRGGKSVSFASKGKQPKNSGSKKENKSKKDKGVQVDEPQQTFHQEKYKKLFGPPNKVDDKKAQNDHSKDPKASTNNNDENIVKDEHKEGSHGVVSSIKDIDSKTVDGHEEKNYGVVFTENKENDDHQKNNHGIGSSVQEIDYKIKDAHDKSHADKDNHGMDSSTVHDIQDRNIDEDETHTNHESNDNEDVRDETHEAVKNSENMNEDPGSSQCQPGGIQYIYIVGEYENKKDDDAEDMEEESADVPKDDNKKKDDSMQSK